jgi:Ca2+-binding EF-hand superfamily protein
MHIINSCIGLTSTSSNVISENYLSIDEVSEILDVTSIAIEEAIMDNKHSIRSLLINVFKSHDFDNSGLIPYDKFVELMHRTRMGISKQQLRYVRKYCTVHTR